MCAGVRIASWIAGTPDGTPIAESWQQAVQYLDPMPVAEVRPGAKRASQAHALPLAVRAAGGSEACQHLTLCSWA